MQWIKDFKGHSGCKIQLFKIDETYVVYKSGHSKLKESAKLLTHLSSLGFNTPKIYEFTDDTVTMEYINGVDMKTYIFNSTQEDIDRLIDFLNFYISTVMSSNTTNILPELIAKLHSIEKSVDLSNLKFSCLDLLEKLPKTACYGTVHGDFTLDNILFFKNKFYLIDANPTELNFIEYDTNKIRQDLDALWFVRQEKDKISYKIVCQQISNKLKNKWSFLNNDYILIFMLMRVLPYCVDDQTHEFLISEINKLWQL